MSGKGKLECGWYWKDVGDPILFRDGCGVFHCERMRGHKSGCDSVCLIPSSPRYDDGLEYAAAGGMPSVTRIGRVMERGRYYYVKGGKA